VRGWLVSWLVGSGWLVGWLVGWFGLVGFWGVEFLPSLFAIFVCRCLTFILLWSLFLICLRTGDVVAGIGQLSLGAPRTPSGAIGSGDIGEFSIVSNSFFSTCVIPVYSSYASCYAGVFAGYGREVVSSGCALTQWW